MLRVKTLVSALVVAVALLAAGVSGVLANGRGGGFHGGPGGGTLGFGTLSAISATSVTIATPNNSNLTATLDAAATYTARSQAAAVAGLKTGVQVAVRGSSVNGTTTVRALEYDTKPFAAAIVRYTGTVSTSTANSLTLTTTGNQSVTVQLNSNTRYVVGNAKASARPTFTPNQQVRVSAAQMTDGSLVAQTVAVASS